jgi:hypothetical protein
MRSVIQPILAVIDRSSFGRLRCRFDSWIIAAPMAACPSVL